MINFLNGSKSKAFTLAETLITLAIIGIVAAMTIPTLMTKFFDKEMDSKYKKVKTSIINGYKMMLQREQADDVADLPLVRCSENNKACFENQHSGIFAGMTTDVGTLPDKYYLSGGTTVSPFKWSDVPYIFQTKDGVVMGVYPDSGLEYFSVFVDLNGNDEPNIQNKDLYKFRVSKDAVVTDVSNQLNRAANTNFGICSINNLGGCTTKDECIALANSSRQSLLACSNGKAYAVNWFGYCSVRAYGANEMAECIDSYPSTTCYSYYEAYCN